MIHFQLLDPRMTEEHLGFLPGFLDENDPRPAREQIDANYQHGGGWTPFVGFTFNKASHILTYSGDPPMRPLARATLRGETLFFYESAWLCIVQPGGSYEVARVD